MVLYFIMEKEKLPIFEPERIETKDYLKETFEEVKDELSFSEQRVFDLLVPKHREWAPKMEEFNYPDIEKDQKKLIEKQKEAFRKMDKEEKINYIRAKISEAFLAFLIESKWTPKSFYLSETSEFDDWINGVDSVIEFRDNPEKIAVVDFTTSKNREKISEKVQRVLEKIDSGTLSEIKYFKSQRDKKCYHLKMVPPIIIGIDLNTLKNIFDLYSEKEIGEIENHWYKYAFFDQIITQIDYYRKYILNPQRKKYEPKSAQLMAKEYEELKTAIENLKENPLPELKRKGAVVSLREKMTKRDRVYRNIIHITEH